MNVPTAQPTVGWRIALFLLVTAGSLWLGLAAARTVIGGELLEFGTLIFRGDVSPGVERELYRTLGLTGIGVAAAYLCVLLSSIVVLVRAPFRLREHGWIIMSALLLYLFVPVEVFTLVLDLRLASLALGGSEDLLRMRELFLARAGALAGTPFVALLCYYTILGLAVFQPLRRPSLPAR